MGAHTSKLLRKLGQRWGEWENRRYLVDHPRAVEGLTDAWCNDRFAVQLFEAKGFQWLSIRKHVDGATPPTWAELQRIKDELIGPEREAAQVHPRASELVDDADMYHLWLFPADESCPFNFTNVGWKS